MAESVEKLKNEESDVDDSVDLIAGKREEKGEEEGAATWRQAHSRLRLASIPELAASATTKKV